MPYNELVKALRCCSDDNIPCKSCPRYAKCTSDRNMTSLFLEAADAIEELSRVAEAIPHRCECCVGCELEKKNGGCDNAFVLSPKRAMQYLSKRIISIDHQLSEEEIERLCKEIANAPIVLIPSEGEELSKPLVPVPKHGVIE